MTAAVEEVAEPPAVLSAEEAEGSLAGTGLVEEGEEDGGGLCEGGDAAMAANDFADEELVCDEPEVALRGRLIAPLQKKAKQRKKVA